MRDSAKVIKSTEYCDLLNQGRVEVGETVSALERIKVKATGEEEIRFAYYKKTKHNKDRLVLRPLDLNEDELLMLFADAVKKEVFSSKFKQSLKAIL